MVYVGGKQKQAKYIVPIIQDYIDKSGYKTYVEPFVGGANIICKIKAEERIAFDVNKYLIAFLQSINALSPIKFGVSSYECLNAERSVIYCDPPYNNTYNYGLKFDSAKFWNWVRNMSKKHCAYIGTGSS